MRIDVFDPDVPHTIYQYDSAEQAIADLECEGKESDGIRALTLGNAFAFTTGGDCVLVAVAVGDDPQAYRVVYSADPDVAASPDAYHAVHHGRPEPIEWETPDSLYWRDADGRE